MCQIFTLCSVLFVTLQVALVQTEIFSCMVQLKASVAFARKNNVVNYFNAYIEEQRGILGALKSVHTELLEIVDIKKDKNDTAIQNPIVALIYTRASILELNEAGYAVLAGINGTTATFKRHKIMNILRYYPKLTDMHGAGDGVLAIQEVHQFKTRDVASGYFGKYGSPALRFDERITIAQTAPGAKLWVLNDEEYGMVKGLEWLDAALDIANTTNIKQLPQIQALVMAAFSKINCVCSTQYLKMTKRIMALNNNIQVHSNCTSQMPFPCAIMKTDVMKLAEQRNFEAMCRGEEPVVKLCDNDRRTPARHLRCRYSHNNDPRLLISPVKEEEMNLVNPRISVLHDILNENHVKYFQVIAAPFLRRGPVTNKDGQKRTYHKISQQFVVPNTSVNAETRGLVGRLSAISGLNMTGFEDMMVVNYGSGGVYGIHLDVLTRESHANYTRGISNRLATIVTYLNDVEMGGETVFPELGVKVKPKRLSAVMFFNMYKNGETNKLSSHSSCPIVYGEKWIANQWIRSRGQEFDFPCSTNAFQ